MTHYNLLAQSHMLFYSFSGEQNQLLNTTQLEHIHLHTQEQTLTITNLILIKLSIICYKLIGRQSGNNGGGGEHVVIEHLISKVWSTSLKVSVGGSCFVYITIMGRVFVSNSISGFHRFRYDFCFMV